ncbi:MAG: hypothetical protein KBF30_02555 [Hyphomonadaceae bacterium]|nr:hypothetical protein [Hyphomonadaceae bacterium]
MRWMVGIAALILAACAPVTGSATPTPAPAPAPQQVVQKLTPAADEAGCRSQNGSWAPICRMQRPACVLSFSDAGKSCTDSDQCQGACYADAAGGASQAGTFVTGKCATNSNPCGCNARVEDGKASPVLCVD